MANVMESAPSQQGHSATYSRENLTVLNSASHAVLERTIVESFVKLVVCRKMTVQRVAAVSGHVLDSHTTQEEDSPVILDVHRHEVGGVCSAWDSNLRSPSVSGSEYLHHSSQPPSPSSVNLGDDDDHRQHEGSLEDSHYHRKNISCDPSQGNRLPVDHLCKSSDVDNLHCKQKTSNSPGNGLFKKGNSCEPVAFRNTKVKMEKSGQQQCGKGDFQFHTLSHKKRKMYHVDDPDGFVTDKEKVEDPNLRRITSSTGSCESSEGDRTDGVNQKDGSVTLTETQLSLSIPGKVSTDPGADMLALTVTGNQEGSQEYSEGIIEHESMPLDKVEDLMEVDSAEVKLNEESEKRSKKCTDSEVGAEKQTKTEGQGTRTEHISDSVDVDEQGDVEIATSGLQTAGSDPEVQSVPVFVADERNVSVASLTPLQTSCSQFPPASIEDRVAEGQLESLQSDNGDKQISADSEGELLVNKSYEAAEDEETRENIETPDGSETNSHQQKSGEDDSEQDMLVIDISNSMSELTHQNEDDDTAISTSEQTTQKSTEKPDPFLHLLNNFPLLDRSHNKMSCEQDKPDSRTSRMTEDIAAACAPVAVKDEPDDDCMITAAFISSNRKKSAPRFRPAAHTVTSDILAMSAGSSRAWRGRYFARAPYQRRHSMGQYGHGHPPSLQQLQQPLQDFQVNRNVTVAAAAAAAVAAAATGYQSPLSSQTEPSLPPGIAPPTSQPYIPNFLATTPQAGEQLDTESVAAVSGDRALPIDHSQQTYQCAICNRIFLHRHKFDEHVSKCGAHRPYKCKICAKGFNQRAHLDTHMKFHMGIKRYRCDVCHKAYVMKGDLIRHLKTRGHTLTVQAQGLPVQDTAQGLPVQDSVQGLPVQDSAHGLPVQDSAHGLPVQDTDTHS